MENIEVFNKVVECGLIKEIELSKLKKMKYDINQILNVVYRDLEVTFSFERNLICPKCVFDLMDLIKTDSAIIGEWDNSCAIHDWQKTNIFVDDDEYKKMLRDKKDDVLFVSDRLFKRFCCNCLWKIPNILTLTVKQFNDFGKELSVSTSISEFDAKIKNVEDFLKDI